GTWWRSRSAALASSETMWWPRSRIGQRIIEGWCAMAAHAGGGLCAILRSIYPGDWVPQEISLRRHAMKQGFKVMDSDMHIIEPPDLWQCYMEPEFKDQAPRGTTHSVADLGMVGPDGTPWGRNPKNVQHLGQDRRRGHSFARNQERFKPYEDMGWTGD